ncbi:MAG TPA: prepilin-type N-terminal cleavage/methylation domain-containing protein [Polyangiales bacterium]|nr:prepilin-type N-terminal cleavage/methylation domain-containing protein [Polyangiales bacterium]
MQQYRRRRRGRQRSRRREGLTLIEIMVAMVIMAMVAGAVAVAAMGAWGNAQKHETATRARTLQSAVSMYMFAPEAECPTVEDLLRSRVIDPTTDTDDGWGNAFAIECEENVIHVKSAGPDETMGTEDDIGF